MAGESLAQQKANFEATLCDYSALASLYKFLEKEFSSENLDFVLACRAVHPKLGRCLYRDSVFPQGIDTDGPRLAWIYETFIPEDAPRQVNLPNDMRNRLTQTMASEISVLQSGTSPDAVVLVAFEDAYEEIINLMVNDSYKRFLSRAKPVVNIDNRKKGFLASLFGR